MTVLTFWCLVELTSSHTPVTVKDEFVFLVQDSIGLYQGKSKIIARQNGRVYLTSSRLIYVDNISPIENSLSISLFNIDHLEFYSGFLKSSPKITIWFKDHSKNSSAPSSATNLNKYIDPTVPRFGGSNSNELLNKEDDETIWVCTICYFANQIKNSQCNFDKILTNDFDFNQLPICKNCGMKPKKNTITSAVRKLRSTEQTKQRVVLAVSL